jgi:sRNA-binding protein
LTAAQVRRADAVIDCLSRLWPSCFQIFERRRRPLAIGIDQALFAQLELVIRSGRISEFDITCALRRYTGALGYLENVAIIGNARVGLDGKAVSIVSEKHAQRARDIVAKRKAQRELNRNSTLTVEEGKAAPMRPTRLGMRTLRVQERRALS